MLTSLTVGEWQGRTVIVSGNSDAIVQMWDMADRTPLGELLQGHSDTISSIAMREWQGRTVMVTGSHDGTIRLWQAGHRNSRRIDIGSPVYSVAMGPDETIIVGAELGLMAIKLDLPGDIRLQ
jgi:WD40 repeat protein